MEYVPQHSTTPLRQLQDEKNNYGNVVYSKNSSSLSPQYTYPNSLNTNQYFAEKNSLSNLNYPQNNYSPSRSPYAYKGNDTMQPYNTNMNSVNQIPTNNIHMASLAQLSSTVAPSFMHQQQQQQHQQQQQPQSLGDLLPHQYPSRFQRPFSDPSTSSSNGDSIIYNNNNINSDNVSVSPYASENDPETLAKMTNVIKSLSEKPANSNLMVLEGKEYSTKSLGPMGPTRSLSGQADGYEGRIREGIRHTSRSRERSSSRIGTSKEGRRRDTPKRDTPKRGTPKRGTPKKETPRRSKESSRSGTPGHGRKGANKGHLGVDKAISQILLKKSLQELIIEPRMGEIEKTIDIIEEDNKRNEGIINKYIAEIKKLTDFLKEAEGKLIKYKSQVADLVVARDRALNRATSAQEQISNFYNVTLPKLMAEHQAEAASLKQQLSIVCEAFNKYDLKVLSCMSSLPPQYASVMESELLPLRESFSLKKYVPPPRPPPPPPPPPPSSIAPSYEPVREFLADGDFEGSVQYGLKPLQREEREVVKRGNTPSNRVRSVASQNSGWSAETVDDDLRPSQTKPRTGNKSRAINEGQISALISKLDEHLNDQTKLLLSQIKKERSPPSSNVKRSSSNRPGSQINYLGDSELRNLHRNRHQHQHHHHLHNHRTEDLRSYSAVRSNERERHGHGHLSSRKRSNSLGPTNRSGYLSSSSASVASSASSSYNPKFRSTDRAAARSDQSKTVHRHASETYSKDNSNSVKNPQIYYPAYPQSIPIVLPVITGSNNPQAIIEQSKALEAMQLYQNFVEKWQKSNENRNLAEELKKNLNQKPNNEQGSLPYSGNIENHKYLDNMDNNILRKHIGNNNNENNVNNLNNNNAGNPNNNNDGNTNNNNTDNSINNINNNKNIDGNRLNNNNFIHNTNVSNVSPIVNNNNQLNYDADQDVKSSFLAASDKLFRGNNNNNNNSISMLSNESGKGVYNPPLISVPRNNENTPVRPPQI